MGSLLLAQNVTFKISLDSSSLMGVNLPIMSDLLPSLYIGLGLVFAQTFAQNVAFKRLALALGVVRKETRGSLQNVKLLLKFSESLWKLLCYSSLCFYGAATLFRKSWIWDTRDYWTDFPFQNVDPDIKNYFLAEMGLYISLSVTQFLGPKRKDFWMMAIHHVVAMLLMLLTWKVNGVRAGSAVLLCHDVVDIPLELAKLGDYAKAERVKRLFYHVFVATWFVTRLGLFPFCLLRSAWEHTSRPETTLPEHAIVALLVVLLSFSVCWTYLILKSILSVYVHHKEEKDQRSSEDEGDTQDDRKQR